MKNGVLVTAYLDECAAQQAMARSGDVSQLEKLNALVEADVTGELWRACLNDGWTIAELDNAFERRFNFRVTRQ